MMTKVLASVASLVVIVAGGYFVWGEIRKGQTGACQDRLATWAASYMMRATNVEDEAYLTGCLDQQLLTDAYLMQHGMTGAMLRQSFKAKEREADNPPSAPLEPIVTAPAG